VQNPFLAASHAWTFGWALIGAVEIAWPQRAVVFFATTEIYLRQLFFFVSATWPLELAS
jgi:hypothetical protein